MKHRHNLRCWILSAVGLLCCSALLGQRTSAPAADLRTHSGPTPNLVGNVGRPLRYRPDAGDFIIENGTEFFNRALYGGNTAFRVDGGDKPEFTMYLPGRGGNLRLGIQTVATAIWLKDAARIVTRYRPGSLIYEISDPCFGNDAQVQVELLAYADTEGLIVRVTASHLATGGHLVWAYGGVNGQRGARDGDIGTERVPISQYFQFQPMFAVDNSFALLPEGFTLMSPHATIAGVVPEGTVQHTARAGEWNDLPALLSATEGPEKGGVVVGVAPLPANGSLLLSLQRVTGGTRSADDPDIYRDVTTRRPGKDEAPAVRTLPARFQRVALAQEFAAAQKHFDDLRSKVVIATPDPYLDAAMGALNVVSDALWDDDAHAIMHGAIAWRTKLLGWRGPYVLDDLGWHERALQNFETWLPHQNTSPIGPIPPADSSANLSRNEKGLHSNGDLSNSHYDMNLVFMDALFRHLLWTGDKDFARRAWPVIQRHLAWERRSFRREYGPDKLPLYEAYADIWASDDLYYNGGGSAYASAYNVYENRMAARVAELVGDNPKPFLDEASQIETAMHKLLWLPERGTFAEYKDRLGLQLVHPDYGLWNFYHTVDEGAVTQREAWQMGSDLLRHMRAIPVEGAGVPNDLPYHVFSGTDWMPYSWSINNVVMEESMHTALALWEGGHADDAYSLAKGALLASMFMGISPGNVGTMQYLDVYRRESQRDFGDSAGTMSRAIIEGLFGLHPDALAETLTVSPGFPGGWTHARLIHPDVSLAFQRNGRVDTWHITQHGKLFQRLVLRVPAVSAGVSSVQVNAHSVPWRSDPNAAGRPTLEIDTAFAASAFVRIEWIGEKVDAGAIASSSQSAGPSGRASAGAFTWWAPASERSTAAPANEQPINWLAPIPGARFESVDLTAAFNDRVTAIFEPGKYLSPRSTGVSLSQPSQGAGAWAGHTQLLPVIDDTGLRRVAGENGDQLEMPNGVTFHTPSSSASDNILFTSQWSNYPHQATLPLNGQARHAFFLMAGSTDFMQSRIDNGEIVITYTDGSSARLALRNPETWWPIEQDYFIDDYQFPFTAALPPRVDLKTGQVRVLQRSTFLGQGREVPGGAATVLDLALDPRKHLKQLTLRTFTNDSVIGLMSVTLERPSL